MSEFLSVCPKCHQRILCDTLYAGQRVACPMCLQEITMPEPPQAVTPSAATPAAPAAASGGARGIPIVAVVVGGVLLVAAMAAAFVVWQKKSPPTPTPPQLVNQAPVAPVTPIPTAKPVATTRQAPAANAAKNMTLDSTLERQLRALWTFDRDSGTTAVDMTGNGNNATLAGDQAAWSTTAKVGTGALSLDGTNSCAETAGPVVDTTQSFTVAAWVNFSVVDGSHCLTAVSMDANETSVFYLQWNRGQHGHFLFSCKQVDSKTSDRISASSTMTAHPNTWYHLAGVYNAEAKSISLYVNGALQETTPCDTPVRATGKTAIGRARSGKVNVDFVPGLIDDVRIYASALTAEQIQGLAGN